MHAPRSSSKTKSAVSSLTCLPPWLLAHGSGRRLSRVVRVRHHWPSFRKRRKPVSRPIETVMDLNTIREIKHPASADEITQWQDGYAWLAGGTWLFSEP